MGRWNITLSPTAVQAIDDARRAGETMREVADRAIRAAIDDAEQNPTSAQLMALKKRCLIDAIVVRLHRANISTLESLATLFDAKAGA